MLELVKRSSGRFLFHVCGNGPLADAFAEVSRLSGDVRFHGQVDDATLFDLIAECDVLVNVHASIEKMGNGVFPFKVVEYVASGRLVISTDLPPMSLHDVIEAVHFVAPRVESIQDALSDAPHLYAVKRQKIEKAMAVTRDMLSANALEHAITSMLFGPQPSPDERADDADAVKPNSNREEHRHA